ncbi:alpha/beta hydrolase [Spirosoma utsteinense]|uniref:S-formylglutathione hydrolase FrmB n=1 Tax=Spirosoma utsteinense TaxID=2585773 RepID=A0ABR6WCP8_9BACT|nr:alpha/beta hydrolase family protein [Spirosoma utsteinense]MBC3786814.1 S-formylglutathione hydrolase FrmB [Spirosoma utsteinense]MBC3793765.1 S-formylglutathione hydrolase FrmB [Spirosoma utsteinense]
MSTRTVLLCALITLSAITVPAQSRRRAQLTAPQSNSPVPVVSAPQARLLESLRFNSSLMNQAINYSIYLPPDYYVSNRRYPVVYLLHGYGDNETSWVQFGEVDRIVDDNVKTGHLPPMIIVMPNGGASFYVNDYQNKVRYEDMFVQELIPYIDSSFRTRPQREYRAISGLSMGGFGSLALAMHRPDLFGSCAALSAAARTDEMFVAIPEERYNAVFSPVFSGPATGNDRLTLTWKRNNPITLARSAPEGDLKKVRWYIDCGDDDALSAGNSLLHIALLDRRIPHEYRVRDGAHTWAYWRTGLPDALKFIAENFRR